MADNTPKQPASVKDIIIFVVEVTIGIVIFSFIVAVLEEWLGKRQFRMK